MLQYQSDHLMLISEVSLLQEQLFLEVNCSDILNTPYKILSLAVSCYKSWSLPANESI